ncbi:MAG: hypothetical protein CL916_12780, partial [Deltaproteobacteria bacterium]|nr:hypothetical protein [Deltaproteobacteria bacterium]
MHEKQEPHTKGFLHEQTEGNTLCWIRRDGVLLERITGTAPFEERITYEDQEYASRIFVQGVSFRGFCEQNTFDLPTFAKIVKAAMKGLKSLHERDILHGKITADNLIISAYDMQPVWVDHINEGSKSADWDSFWLLFLSQIDRHDVGVEFFCAQLSVEENKEDFVEKWSSSDSLSLWDTKFLQQYLCDGVEIPSIQDIQNEAKENMLRTVPQEQKKAWISWIAEGKKGEELASLFLDVYPYVGEPTLLHVVSEGILLGRMSPITVEKYEEMFGGGEQEREELELAKNAVFSAQRVWDLEQEIERLESLSWYERSFGEAKETLSTAR